MIEDTSEQAEFVAGFPGRAASPSADLMIDRFDFFYLVRRHLRLLVGIPVLCLALAFVYSMVKQPLFESSVTIYLDPNFDQTLQVGGAAGANQTDLDSLKSLEVAIIGDSVVLRVIDRLGLRDEEGFFPTGISAEVPPADIDMVRFLQAERFKAKLIEETRLIQIDILDPVAERAQRIASAFAEEFESFLIEQRQEEAKVARQVLESQAEKARGLALAAAKRLGEFRESHPDFPIEQDHDLVAQRLTQFSNELNTAVRERLKLESLQQTLNQLDADTSPITVVELAGNEAMTYVSALLSQRAAAEGVFAGADKQFTSKDPRHLAATAVLKRSEEQLDKLASDIRTTVKSKYLAAKIHEEALREQLTTLQHGLVEMKALSSGFRALQQQVERDWSVHETLQAQLSESVIAEEARGNVATVVSAPLVATEKASPNLFLLVLVFGGVGAFASAGWLVFCVLRGLPYLDRRQLEWRLGLHVIADWTDEQPEKSGGEAAIFLRLLGSDEAKAIQISAPALNGIGESVASSIASLSANTGLRTLLVVIDPKYPAQQSVAQSNCHIDGNLVRLEVSPDTAMRGQDLAETLRRARADFGQIYIEAGACESSAVVEWLSSLADKNVVVVGKGTIRKQEVDDRVEHLLKARMPPVSLMMIDPETYTHEASCRPQADAAKIPPPQRFG
jgi:uncharacterized protein involved in exopolysaccharide biosynthesis